MIYYMMSCDCILKESEIKIRYKNFKIGQGQYKSCPVHIAFVVERVGICLNCGVAIIPKTNKGEVSKRCPKHHKIHHREQSRIAAKKRYWKNQAAKGLIVNPNGVKPKSDKEVIKNVELKKTPITKKLIDALFIIPEPEEKRVFKNPVAALTLGQALTKNVRCIPAANLFEFKRMMSGGWL